MEANIIRQKKGNKKKQCMEVEGDDKSYKRWTLEMEVSLANILRDQHNMGNKGDIGWKPVAYKTASHLLSAQFKEDITPDNVRNRIKTWRRFYGVVSDIISQNGFSWDSTKKMITFDDENEWNEYCKATPKAKSFKFKVIPNWDDIVDLCGKDRASGELAETAEEADDVMSANEQTNDNVSGTQALDTVPLNEDNTPTSTQSQKKGKKKQCMEVEGDGKSYMRWTLEMEVALANILRDQRNMSNKGDIAWKPVAYNVASHLLSAQFKEDITPDNVRNRVKTWRRFYGVVSDILSQSGFSWDSTKKMITFNDENTWNEYCKATPKAKCFKFKVIPNWDDIVDICGKDRTTGELVETAEKADDVMSADEQTNDTVGGAQALVNIQLNEDNTPTSTQSQKKRSQFSSSSASRKKRVGSEDALATAVHRMASSLEEYLLANAKKLDAGEVYDEVNGVPGLEEEQRLKACVWFMENEKQFELLKKLPIEKKEKLILMLIR